MILWEQGKIYIYKRRVKRKKVQKYTKEMRINQMKSTDMTSENLIVDTLILKLNKFASILYTCTNE